MTIAAAAVRRWTRARLVVRPPAPPAEVARLMTELEIGPDMAAVIWSRGLRQDVADHLAPPLRRSDIPGLQPAAERLERAIRNRERILLHGDYDADGISGTALLVLGLRELGANAEAFLPNRLTDGYGIHPDRVVEHAERADVFVTIDCGISNVAEIRCLCEAGIDVIVTDHHAPGEELPSCLVVHPSHAPTAAPGRAELTGAGVAFHLLWALRERLGLDAPLDYADLATLGTVADVAPLLGENRALIREGLRRMTDSRWPGLKAAVAQSSLRGDVSARDVAFILAPRLNAAGRLGEAEKALELLMTASERRGRELAAYLDARNDDRRRIQDEMLAAALERVDPEAPAIVVGDDAWHPGVMGIVASKILEQHYRPVFIHAQGKGSVRSTPGISAVGALRAAAPHLKRFGGHQQAAGFAIEPDRVEAFRAAVEEFAARHPKPIPTVVADGLLDPASVEEGLLRAMHELEPFGEGHDHPRFVLRGALEMARAVGRDGKTLQLRIGGIKGVAWQMGDAAPSLPIGRPVAAVVELRENEWNGRRSIEFTALDVREAEPLCYDGALADAPRVRRGRASHTSGIVVGSAESVPGSPVGPLVLHDLLLDVEQLHATAAIERLVRAGHELWFDLDAAALEAVERHLDRYPTIHDLRRAFVCKQRGAPAPFPRAKTALVDQAFRELDLIDDRGRLRRSARRNPISSPTARDGLLERYKLRTFVDGYRCLDDDAFAAMVHALFGAAVD